MTTTPTTDPLVERYVAAVSARIPADQRDDVAAELRAGILDAVEDRLAADPSLDRSGAARQELLALGHPVLLARGYAGPRFVIAPEQYEAWSYAVRAISLAAAPITGLVTTAVGIWTEEPLLEAVLSGVWLGLTVALHVVFWVTLTFWLLGRNGRVDAIPEELTGVPGSWDPDDLPATTRSRSLGLKETAPGIGFLLVTLAWLPWQHFRSPLRDDAGERIPILDPGLWPSGWLWALVVVLAVGIGVEVVKYVVGRWSLAVTVLVAVVELVTGALLVAMVSTQQVVSNPLLARATDPATVSVVVERIVVVVAVGVVVVSVWEAIRGHLRDRSGPPSPLAP